MATQLGKLASTAKTAKPIGGRIVKTKVAKVGATPWKPARTKRGGFYRGRAGGVGRPGV